MWQGNPSSQSSIVVGAAGLGRRVADDTAAAADARLARSMLTGPFPAVDTSNEYAGGRSERILGEALAELGSAATAQVFTKVDRDAATGVFDRDRVLRSMEESLCRLGVERVPLLHLHDPYTISFAEAMGPGGAVEALIELRDEGITDAIGIAAGPVGLVGAYVRTGVFDAVLCHNRYTLIDRSAEALFRDATARGMRVFNAAPFGAGILSRGPDADARYAYQPVSDELVRWVRGVESVCRAHGTTLPGAALHFSLRAPFVDATVAGVSSVARLTELAELAANPPAEALWPALDALGPAPSPIHDPEEAE